jgi:L-amino acid N-acyltransferase YncA
MDVRPVESADVEPICRIYNHYIENTTVTFEEVPLVPSGMAARMETFTKDYPWLVCIDDGEVAGYAYAARWKERTAYRRTAEATVYVRAGLGRRGFGRALYTSLVPALFERGCHAVLGCIALPNEGSVGLHERLGFRKVAHFTEVGRKFERWIDVGYWQLINPNRAGTGTAV